MRAILDILMIALNLYTWAVIGSAVLSWLIAFNVINMRNDVVRSLASALYQLTEPAMRPIRRMLPNLGTLDISPIILLLLIMLIERVIMMYVYPYVF
jgi:YggT family protein